MAAGTSARDVLARAAAVLLLLAAAACSQGEPPPADGDGDSLPPGRWKPVPAATAEAGATAEQLEAIERLRSIGYVGGSVDDTRHGVTVYDRAACDDGLNFYTSGHAAEAVLMDMEGRVLHRWHRSFSDIWPDSPDRERLGATWWRRARLLPDGGILAIFEGLGLVELDRDSNVRWARANGAHHDLDVRPDGSIWVLTRTIRRDHPAFPGTPIFEDFVTVLDPAGRELRRISLLEAFLSSGYRSFLDGRRRRDGDIFHTNTVRVLDGRLADRSPAFRSGNVLTSMNGLGVIAVLDVDSETIAWARRQPPRGQHDAQILPDGYLLFFDNRDGSGASAVREIDPLTDLEHWSYRGGPERPFYSQYCGSAQRLANGNTLITASDAGRAFEVRPSGEIVWEFFNPHRAGPSGEYIATISEMLRLPRDAVSAWLGPE